MHVLRVGTQLGACLPGMGSLRPKVTEKEKGGHSRRTLVGTADCAGQWSPSQKVISIGVGQRRDLSSAAKQTMEPNQQA